MQSPGPRVCVMYCGPFTYFTVFIQLNTDRVILGAGAQITAVLVALHLSLSYNYTSKLRVLYFLST